MPGVLGGDCSASRGLGDVYKRQAFLLAFFSSFFLIYIFIADNISISMYIMCVILCLFGALSRRVGALQISIIIINVNVAAI